MAYSFYLFGIAVAAIMDITGNTLINTLTLGYFVVFEVLPMLMLAENTDVENL